MTKLESALIEVASLLEELSTPYMLIGGLAVALWGEARATIDVDFSIWVEEIDIKRVVDAIGSRLSVIPTSPLAFVAASRVLPVNTSSGVRADLVFATLATEREIIDRATPKVVGGKPIMVASVEDLIWMKLLSERPKDNQDARLLLRRFADVLDRGYLGPRLREISEAFARADIIEIFNRELKIEEREP